MARNYLLKLYVIGSSGKSRQAVTNLQGLLEEELPGQYRLDVIDLLKNPDVAEEKRIVATPALEKILPPPLRLIIGDLADREKLRLYLDLDQ